MSAKHRRVPGRTFISDTIEFDAPFTADAKLIIDIAEGGDEVTVTNDVTREMRTVKLRPAEEKV